METTERQPHCAGEETEGNRDLISTSASFVEKSRFRSHLHGTVLSSLSFTFRKVMGKHS